MPPGAPGGTVPFGCMRPQPAPIGKSGVTPLRTQVNYLKRKAQSSVFILWTGGILVCLLAVLLALLLSSCGSGDNVPVTTDPPVTETDPGTAQTGGTEPTDNGGETAAPSAQPSAASGSTILGETADAGQEYIDKLTFLGDSTTYGLRYYKMLSGGTDTTQVWTPTNGTLTLSYYATATIPYPAPSGTEITIQEAARQAQPEYLVITLGVNGVSFMNEETFKDCYTKLIQNILEVSPNTKIICNSIYPVGRSYEYLADINNDKITAANEWIKAVAAETGTRYSDTCSVLKDSEGWLRDDYQNGDYIHLNSDGFTAVLNYLRTHAYQ